MPATELIKVKDLSLDLFNFRTIKQTDEIHAVQAMISISPDRFWALMESLLSDGYLLTENIIVLKSGKNLMVKEGNRRVAALKLIHGYISQETVTLPDNISQAISNLSQSWKNLNLSIPCAVYEKKDATLVDKIVTLAHGKGEKASRDQWNAVARARHNRDMSKVSEPALDLLEKYIKLGMNLTPNQAGRWSGEYPLSVLDEVMKKLAPRLELANATELSKKYPATKYRDSLENILKDIGLQNIRFDVVRNKNFDFAIAYGIPGPPTSPSTNTQTTTPSSTNSTTATAASSAQAPTSQQASGATATTSQTNSSASPNSASSNPSNNSKSPAVSINDPRAVTLALKSFTPLGANREKVVTLLNEAKKLKLSDNPMAFCFILRSMFEISSKAYCDDNASNGLAYKKPNGEDKKLVDVLRDVTKHLTNNNSDKQIVKNLHGAMAELGKNEGLLSVTSMNQLVHNPKFSVTANDISTLFGNIFPLLRAMNQ